MWNDLLGDEVAGWTGWAGWAKAAALWTAFLVSLHLALGVLSVW